MTTKRQPGKEDGDVACKLSKFDHASVPSVICKDRINDKTAAEILAGWTTKVDKQCEQGITLVHSPFPHCIVSNIVEKEADLDTLLLELQDLEFAEKNNDLYQFHQTSEDLKSAASPYIKQFRNQLCTRFRDWLVKATGIPLNDTVDMFCARYGHTDTLLCHDDELEGRRIAYIFYLVKSWREADGGALDLFSVDGDYQPVEIVKSIVPTKNSLVFFEVSPGSYHQVAEVLTQDKNRWSIGGWFHGPPIQRPSPYLEAPRQLCTYGTIDDEVFFDWINPVYMGVGAQGSIQEKFEMDSEIELQDFILPEKYEELLAALKAEDVRWKRKGPPNKRCYDQADPESLPTTLQTCIDLFKSDAMFLMLSNFTGLKLHELAGVSSESEKEESESENETAASSSKDGDSSKTEESKGKDDKKVGLKKQPNNLAAFLDDFDHALLVTTECEEAENGDETVTTILEGSSKTDQHLTFTAVIDQSATKSVCEEAKNEDETVTTILEGSKTDQHLTFTAVKDQYTTKGVCEEAKYEDETVTTILKGSSKTDQHLTFTAVKDQYTTKSVCEEAKNEDETITTILEGSSKTDQHLTFTAVIDQSTTKSVCEEAKKEDETVTTILEGSSKTDQHLTFTAVKDQYTTKSVCEEAKYEDETVTIILEGSSKTDQHLTFTAVKDQYTTKSVCEEAKNEDETVTMFLESSSKTDQHLPFTAVKDQSTTKSEGKRLKSCLSRSETNVCSFEPIVSQASTFNDIEEFKPEIDSSYDIVISSDTDENIEGLEFDLSVDMKNIIDSMYNEVVQLEEGGKISEEESTCSDKISYKDMENLDNVEDRNMEENDAPVDEMDKLRDKKNPDVYVVKVLKSNLHKTKQIKKKERVYNSKHACFYCDALVLHIRAHMTSKHKKEHLVQNALSAKTGTLMSLLRSKGNDKHNQKVIEEGRGCLLISRRPTKELVSELYGPCIHCREWMLKTTLKRHQANCTAQEILDIPSLTKRNLVMQSDILSGRLKYTASPTLQKEVFTIMTSDKISEIAKQDSLIVALGESWLRRNIDNKLKRKYYASQRMRLNARLLICLRDIDNSTMSMWEFLVPQKFDFIAQAAISVALPTMEDEEDLKSPSNAIKLKYDIIRLVNAKWCICLKENCDEELIRDCQGVLKLIETEWPEKVTRFARMVLAQRQREIKNYIPAPNDIKLLNEHVSAELKTSPMRKQLPDFQKVVRLVQTKLLLYNKRRSGEIDAISVRNYANRSTHLDDVDESLVGDLSELERHLLYSQELMSLRGKRNRPVPCILPPDVKQPLIYISNAEVRAAVAIDKNNTYLFANKGLYCTRAYDSLKATCNEISLRFPDRITSVNLRKYSATLSQVLNLQPNELQWLCGHLGHTTRVHLEHYRQMSGFIERVNISKMLLIQDMNMTGKFVGKTLSDIESIPLEDILNAGQNAGNNETQNEADIQADIEADIQADIEADYEFEEDSEFMCHEEDEGVNRKRRMPQERQKKSKRQKWSEIESEEIEKYFHKFIQLDEGCSSRCRSEIRRWRDRCYTLVHDTDTEGSEFTLDVVFYVGCQDWETDYGGFTSYIVKGEDEELLTVTPKANALALVYRDKETLKFVKYLNSKVRKMQNQGFYDISTVYFEKI